MHYANLTTQSFLEKESNLYLHSQDHEVVVVAVLLVVDQPHHEHVLLQDQGVHDEASLEVQDVRFHALDHDHHVKILTLTNNSK